jgi:cytochrome c-type biogenesis protein CcmH/NrfG
LRRAIQINRNHPEARYFLGDALQLQGNLDEAVAELRRAIRIKPDYAEPHLNLGVAFWTQSKPDEAVAELREAIRRKPDLAEAHACLGSILRAQGHRDEAIGELREAIRIRPDLAEPHLHLGDDLISQGKLDEAVTELREAIRRKPDLAEAYMSLGITLGILTKDQDKRDEGIRLLREAVRIKPDLAEAHMFLGDILTLQGQRDQAIAEYREALRIKPTSPRARACLLKAESLDPQGTTLNKRATDSDSPGNKISIVISGIILLCAIWRDRKRARRRGSVFATSQHGANRANIKIENSSRPGKATLPDGLRVLVEPFLHYFSGVMRAARPEELATFAESESSTTTELLKFGLASVVMMTILATLLPKCGLLPQKGNLHLSELYQIANTPWLDDVLIVAFILAATSFVSLVTFFPLKLFRGAGNLRSTLFVTSYAAFAIVPYIVVILYLTLMWVAGIGIDATPDWLFMSFFTCAYCFEMQALGFLHRVSLATVYAARLVGMIGLVANRQRIVSSFPPDHR